MDELRQLQKEANDIAHEKGWYDEGPRNIGDVIALMHSELSEALEEWRGPYGLKPVYYEPDSDKPEGFGIELADAVIRIMDTCQEHKIDLAQCIRTKMDYNKTRPYRHGGKRA